MTLEAYFDTVPRTTTDIVFEALHAQILSLELLPGTRISEADVAEKLGVSRQPVRNAFNRLSNLHLVKVRPQRATVVSGFSMSEIANARFFRLAVELEVTKLACHAWDDRCSAALNGNLERQEAALKSGQIDDFHHLDYEFHKLICELSGHPLAFQTILACKQKVDRLCMLSLARAEEVAAVMVDHERIADALSTGSSKKVETVIRSHLGRLDQAIKDIHQVHSKYFDI